MDGRYATDTLTPEQLEAIAGVSPTPTPDPSQPPAPEALIVTEEELAAARLTPRCIVREHTYADVAQVVAPGSTGKANARGHTLDQYSGRGGSALADGTRMTTVLQAWSPEDGTCLHPPIGCHPGPGVSISVLARAKLSYAPPHLPRIWIRREGFRFEHFTEAPRLAPEVQRAAHADQLERFLSHELSQGRHHTQTTLEAYADQLGMTRTTLRAALTELRVSGRVIEQPLPQDQRQGGRKAYLHPAARFGGVDDPSTHVQDPTPPTLNPAAAYRGENPGGVDTGGSPPTPYNPAADGWRGWRGWNMVRIRGFRALRVKNPARQPRRPFGAGT